MVRLTCSLWVRLATPAEPRRRASGPASRDGPSVEGISAGMTTDQLRGEAINAAPRRLRLAAISGAIWSATGMWGRQVASLAVIAVLSRLLTPEDFGVFALVLAFVTLAQAVINDGLADAVVQREEVSPEHLNAAFWICLGCGVGVAAVLAAIAVPVERLYDAPGLADLIWAGCVVIAGAGSAAVHQGILMRTLRFKQLALRTLVGVICGGLTGVGLALAGAGAWALLGQLVVEQTVSIAIMWYTSGWRPSLRFSRAAAADLLPFTMKTAGARLLLFAYSHADRFLVGLLAGTMILGLYAFAMRLYETLITLLSRTVAQVAFVAFAKIQGDRQRLKQAFLEAMPAALALSIPVLLAIGANAPLLVSTLFGSRWLASGQALALVIATSPAVVLGSFCGAVIRGTGGAGLFMALIAVGAAGNLLAVGLLLPYGIQAAALGIAVRQLLSAPLDIWALERQAGIPARKVYRECLPIVFASTSGLLAWLGVIVWAAPDMNEWVRGGLATGAGLAVYAVILFLTGRRIVRTWRALAGLALNRGRQEAALKDAA